MKIWSDIPRVSGIYDKHKNFGKIEKTSGVTAKKDVVSISGTAKDFQTVMNALKNVPDVRQDKVSDLSQRYESGNYSVSGSSITDKIFQSLQNNKA